MRALVWHGKNDIRCDTVKDPGIEDAKDVVLKVTATAICGSDLHLMDGVMPGMQSGDILGHEFMGEVVEIGSEVTRLKKGDRVVVPFTIACGDCFFCNRSEPHLCQKNKPHGGLMDGTSRVRLNGEEIAVMSFLGNMAEYAVVPGICVAKIDEDVS